MGWRFRLVAASMLGLALIAGSAAADTASLHGSILDREGKPLAGAIVTLTGQTGHSVSAYTTNRGAWRLHPMGLDGELTLRSRLPRYADTTRTLRLDEYGGEPLVLHMEPYDSDAALAASLTAGAHAATIEWHDEAVEKSFVSQCLFCHQMGNDWTRKDADQDYWGATMRRMEGYGSLITRKEGREIRRTLSRSFDDVTQARPQDRELHDELARARYREWAFGGGSNYVHDIEIGRDGRLYGVDMGADLVWIIDPRTNEVDRVAFPESDLPLGGMFSGGVAPLGTFAARHGPHSIVEGPDGRMYMTCSLAGEICIFDPETRAFEFVPTGEDSVYPHTLRFDSEGVLWFTLALSNQIGRMDVSTNEITLIQLPSNGFWRAVTDALLPAILEVSSWFGKRDLYVHLSHHKISGQGYRVFNLPYGLDINPVDGSIWYSKLYADFIGRVDQRTLEVEEYPTPHAGPRRMRFAKDGTLWIPSFNEGVLTSFDTRTREFTASHRLPRLNEGEYETPYALNIHPDTGEIWITGNMSDRMLRFQPETERFLSYPSPTRTMFARDVIFGPDGEVCTSNSNLPASAIEGGRPKMLCIEPDTYPDGPDVVAEPMPPAS